MSLHKWHTATPTISRTANPESGWDENPVIGVVLLAKTNWERATVVILARASIASSEPPYIRDVPRGAGDAKVTAILIRDRGYRYATVSPGDR